MVRRRKIPVRKHHGVRDPLKQLEEKEKKLKNSVNNPPEKANEERLSYKFRQFKKIADAAKAGKKFKKTVQIGREDRPGVGAAAAQKGKTKKNESVSNTKRFKNIKQFPGESDHGYMRRVNRITSESLREAQYEAKYGVNVLHDPKTGNITVKKRPKNEIDQLLENKRKEKRHGKGGKVSKQAKAPAKPIDRELAKSLIKQAIKEDDEEKRQEKTQLTEYKRDEFKFGEVVHAPPTLSTLPRKAQRSETVPRPGKKNNLLLKSMLQQTDASASSNKTPTSSANKAKSKKPTSASTKAQLSGKRRDLPVATRSMLETEQNKLIEIYRQMKKSKEQQQS